MRLSDGDVLTLGVFQVEFVRDDREKLSLGEDAASDSPQTSARPVTAFKDLIPEPAAEQGKVAAQELRAARRACGCRGSGPQDRWTRPLPELMTRSWTWSSRPRRPSAPRCCCGIRRPTADPEGGPVPRREQERFSLALAGAEGLPRALRVKLDRTHEADLREPDAALGRRGALWEQQSVTGVIYADSRGYSDAFDEAQRDLLSALANSPPSRSSRRGCSSRSAGRSATGSGSAATAARRRGADRGRFLQRCRHGGAEADGPSFLRHGRLHFTRRDAAAGDRDVDAQPLLWRMTDGSSRTRGRSTSHRRLPDAAFGAPLPARSCTSAARRRARSARRRARLNASSGESLGFRIGLNSGAAVAATWAARGGASGRCRLDVNLASRTEAWRRTTRSC